MDKIRNYFKNRQWSELDYLADESVWQEAEENLGYYFFLLDQKGEDTTTIFDKILQRFQSKSATYRYLGDIAHQLFSDRDQREIATYYYEQALENGEEESETLWLLYLLTAKPPYFLQAVKADYQKQNFENLAKWLFYNLGLHIPVDAQFDCQDWQLIQEVCLDERVAIPQEIGRLRYNNLLLLCYFRLGEYEKGYQFFDKIEHAVKEIVDLYREKGIISAEYASKKISMPWFFEKNAKQKYQYIKIQAEKEKFDTTYLVRDAFKAEEYNDVISIVARLNHSKLSDEICLYYILSALRLGREIDPAYEKKVKQRPPLMEDKIRPDFYPSYLIYRVFENITQLESMLVKEDIVYKIEEVSLYQESEQLLSYECLYDHCLYNFLKNKLQTLDEKWEEARIKYQSAQLAQINQPLTADEENEFISNLIASKSYRQAIAKLLTLPPSMYNNHKLGVCYDHLGEFDLALGYYQAALDLMYHSGELNPRVLSDYLYRQKLKVPDDPSYETYIDDINRGIAQQFRYPDILLQNGHSLFKYYPFNQFTLDALINGYFYLACAEQLNDPLELPYNSLFSERPNVHLQPHFRISSLSNNENSMLMWSHYAQQHTGLMVEYCFQDDLPSGVGIQEVVYDHSAKRSDEKDKYTFNQYLLVKNKCWSYEQEVRLFAYKQEKLYYQEIVYPNKVKERANVYIKSITLGYKFPESTIKLIQSIIATLNAARSENLDKIVLKQAKLSEDNVFELVYQTIE